MISSFLGFLMVLGCIGIGLMVLVYGMQFLIMIVVLIAAGIAGCIKWITEQFK